MLASSARTLKLHVFPTCCSTYCKRYVHPVKSVGLSLTAFQNFSRAVGSLFSSSPSTGLSLTSTAFLVSGSTVVQEQSLQRFGGKTISNYHKLHFLCPLKTKMSTVCKHFKGVTIFQSFLLKQFSNAALGKFWKPHGNSF